MRPVTQHLNRTLKPLKLLESCEGLWLILAVVYGLSQPVRVKLLCFQSQEPVRWCSKTMHGAGVWVGALWFFLSLRSSETVLGLMPAFCFQAGTKQ